MDVFSKMLEILQKEKKWNLMEFGAISLSFFFENSYENTDDFKEWLRDLKRKNQIGF